MKTKKTNKTNQINKINSNTHPYDSQWMELPVDKLRIITTNEFGFLNDTNDTYASNYVKSGQRIKIFRNGSETEDDGVIYSVYDQFFRVWIGDEKNIVLSDTIDRVMVALRDVPEGAPQFFKFNTKPRVDEKITPIEEHNRFMVIGNRVEVYLNIKFKFERSHVGNVRALRMEVPITSGSSAMNYFDMIFCGFAEDLTDRRDRKLYITVHGSDKRSRGYGRDYIWLCLDIHPDSHDQDYPCFWQVGKTYRITGNYYYYLA